MELSLKLNYEAMVKKKKEQLCLEPIDGPNVATIRFQLPKSSKLTRRFHGNEKVSVLFDFLTVHFNDTGSSVRNFSLSTHFPKQELTQEMNHTLDQVVMLFV
jgi:hypothetical protein